LFIKNKLINVPFELTGERLEDKQKESALIQLEKAYTDTRNDINQFEDSDAKLLIYMLDNPLFRGGILDRIDGGQSVEDSIVQTTWDSCCIRN